MKRRIYLIVALALVNVVIMKYRKSKSEKEGTWVMTGGIGATGAADSFLAR